MESLERMDSCHSSGLMLIDLSNRADLIFSALGLLWRRFEMSSLWKRLLVVCIGFACFTPVATAQCVVPDKLDGGNCCTTTQPNYPTPDPFNQNSLQICWRDCDVESFGNCRAEWGAVSSTLGNCKRIRQRLKLKDAAGVTKWKGVLNVQYSRTWLETDAAGNDLQVWRYLVNGDLRPKAAAGLTPCPVPPCAAANGNRVRFTGYLDYAKDCGTNIKQRAWMLTHGCDVIDHAPGFPRAGFFHPNRSYTIVGPAAGFAIGPIQPIAAGGTTLEGVRRVNLGGAGVAASCEFEEQIDCGLQPQQSLCICGFPTASPQWAIADLGLGGFCGTTIFSPGGPFLPGYISMGIGAWTDPGRYPGTESLRWSSGGYDYFDPCIGSTRQEVFFGVTTLRGNQATTINSFGTGFPLPLSFVDQCSSIRSGNTVMNVPFRSDHFLNLNFQ